VFSNRDGYWKEAEFLTGVEKPLFRLCTDTSPGCALLAARRWHGASTGLCVYVVENKGET